MFDYPIMGYNLDLRNNRFTQTILHSHEAPKLIKIIMGLLITTVAYVLVASGGVNSVKGMFVLIGVPVSFVVIACIYASFKLCEKCIREKNYGCLEEAKPAETREETRETPVE